MALTAGEVVNRIKAVMAVQGVPWSDASTRDRFKFGAPDTIVTGIATTFMGTFEAITHAAERGLNMIIPHEDTYWNDADNTLIAEADTLVYRAKIDFMTRHDIVVFRIHDHMHRQRPDFTFSGTAREIGLDPSTETAPNSHRFVIPETTLGELAARVKKIRGADAIRVVGDPAAKVSRVATGAGMATPAVNDPEVDVVIGMFDPAVFEAQRRQSGNFTLTIVNMIGVHITKRQGNQIEGVISGGVGTSSGNGGPGPGGAASLIKSIQLVR